MTSCKKGEGDVVTLGRVSEVDRGILLCDTKYKVVCKTAILM